MTDEQSLASQTMAAMRRLAKSVVVVTTRFEGRRMAMAATAVDSLSLEPPSLLVCVNRSASLFPALAAQSPFCVNILAERHRGLAQRCGGQVSGEARFGEGHWAESAQSLPYLVDAQACVFCLQDAAFQYGTHGIFVGRVSAVMLSGGIEPLIYADARYGTAVLSDT